MERIDSLPWLDGGDWGLLLYLQPAASDVLYTLQHMPEGEHTVKQIVEHYRQVFGEAIHRAVVNNAVNGLEATEFVTFRRSDSYKEPEKYVRLTEKGLSIRF